MKIKFKKAKQCIKKEGGGFIGAYKDLVVEVPGDITFEVERIFPKDEHCVDILVEDDGCIDGYQTFLLDVPKSFFEVVEE